MKKIANMKSTFSDSHLCMLGAHACSLKRSVSSYAPLQPGMEEMKSVKSELYVNFNVSDNKSITAIQDKDPILLDNHVNDRESSIHCDTYGLSTDMNGSRSRLKCNMLEIDSGKPMIHLN